MSKVIRSYCIPFLWLLAIASYLYWIQLPDGYAVNYGIPTHPLQNFIRFSILATIECAILWSILRPGSFENSWGRVLIALTVLLPWAFFSCITTMHMPPIYVGHALWTLFLLALLLFVLIVSIFRFFIFKKKS